MNLTYNIDQLIKNLKKKIKAELEVETDPVKTLISFSEFQKNLNYPDLHPLHHDLAILVTQYINNKIYFCLVKKFIFLFL